jgi:hypothetical protein
MCLAASCEAAFLWVAFDRAKEYKGTSAAPKARRLCDEIIDFHFSLSTVFLFSQP